MTELGDIQLTLGKILANQENFLARLEAHIIEDREVAHRVAQIEKKISWAYGAVAVLTAFLSTAVHFVLKKVSFS